MKYTSLKKGFTLIELLVVITIIGILATGGVAIYTSQIQRARDTVRLNDIKALQSGVEQAYQSQYIYPGADTFNTNVKDYIEKLPKDPKTNQTCNNGGSGGTVICIYSYISGTDANGIAQGAYELSTAFEGKGNVDEKSLGDKGNSNARYETGLRTATLVTDVTTAIGTLGHGACALTGNVPAASPTAQIYINESPNTASNECD